MFVRHSSNLRFIYPDMDVHRIPYGHPLKALEIWTWIGYSRNILGWLGTDIPSRHWRFWTLIGDSMDIHGWLELHALLVCIFIQFYCTLLFRWKLSTNSIQWYFGASSRGHVAIKTFRYLCMKCTQIWYRSVTYFLCRVLVMLFVWI